MKVDMGKSYGPLPMGAWVVLIGGGLGIALYSSRNKKPAAQIVEDSSGVPGVGTGAQSLWVQNAPPAGSDAVADNVFTTNEEWARACVNYLIAQGYDAALADTAVRRYLQSKELSISENALMKVALAKYGAPPVLLPEAPPLPQPPPGGEGGPPPPEDKDKWWKQWWAEFQAKYPPPQAPPPIQPPPPPPPPPPAPSPKTTRWIVVTPWPTKTSTLWGISSVAYGTGTKWPTLYNANKVGVRRPDGSMGMIKDPNLIYAGWKIYCP